MSRRGAATGSPWSSTLPEVRAARVARELVAMGLAVVGLIEVAGCGTAQRPLSTAGIPASLVAQARPIGRGGRFAPPARGPVLGRCGRELGARFGVHVEVFAADRVVLVAAGVGTEPPPQLSNGRVRAARCYGDLVTLDPTGLVLVRRGVRASIGDLFRSWGVVLATRALGGFRARAGARVRAYVAGRPWPGAVGTIPLRPHAEIVLEIGPYVPPHRAYAFAPGL